MKKLEELKLYNFEEICAVEQKTLRGGRVQGNEIIDGGMQLEVEVTAPWISPVNWWTFGFGYSASGFSWGYNATANGSNQSQSYGGGETADNNPGLVSPGGTPTIESQLALLILANPNIKLATSHQSTPADGADPSNNMTDTSEGLPACTSNSGSAKGVTISLSDCLLGGIVTLAENFTFSISEIAGGGHNANSTHYLGNSMDVNWVNGDHVDITNMSLYEVNAFRDAAFAAGAIKVYDPYHDPDGMHSNHFHIQW